MRVAFMMSIWLVTLVSTERFLAICHPIKYRVVNGTKKILAVVGVLVVVSVGFVGMGIPYRLHVAEYCIQWPTTEQFIMYPRTPKLVKFKYFPDIINPYFLLGLTIILTFIIILCFTNFYMNLRTLKTLRARTQNRRLEISTQFERHIRQVSVMVMANTIVFFACISTFVFMSTTQVLNTVKIHFLNEYQYRHVENLTNTFMIINSSVNPLVYFITNQSYRQSFRKTILCGLCKSNHLESSGVSTQGKRICESQL